MKRRWKQLRKLLYSHPVLLILLVLLCTAGLVLVFKKGLEDTAFAYVLYPLSAYTVTVLILRLIPCIHSGRHLLHRQPFFHRYLTDSEFKAEVSIHISFGITVLYCLWKSAASLYYHSAWFGSMAAYYFTLGILRFSLLHQIRGTQQDSLQMFRRYRLCGILLLVLTIALSAMSFYTIYEDAAIQYPGFMIYAAAGFAFYNLTTAIINLFQYRKFQNPIYTAGNLFSLASALVSMLFLQASMFAAFGTGGAWQHWMNLGTAACVFFLILIMAVSMIRRGHQAMQSERTKTS